MRIRYYTGSLRALLKYTEDESKTEPSRQVAGADSFLSYEGKGEKTDARRYVSGINCDPYTAEEQMQHIKERFDRTGGTIAYHGFQSFAPGEVTPEQAHRIGVRFADELWGDRFQVVVTTHLNRETHLHNHFVLNSVSFVDGRRFRLTHAYYLHMREVSNRICREHNLSVIENPGPAHFESLGEFFARRDGKRTVKSTIQEDIDSAIAEARTDEQFFRALSLRGYAYKTEPDIRVRPPGKEHYYRLTPYFGDEYTLEHMRRRYGRTPSGAQRTTVPRAVPVMRHYRLKGKLPRGRKSRLRRMYLYYCYRLGVFPRHPQSPARMHFLLREDLMYLDKYAQGIRFLHSHRIDTIEQLLSCQAEKQQEVERLTRQREALRRRLRNSRDPESAEHMRKQMELLQKAIREIRKEVRICQDIHTRSAGIPQKLEIIRRYEAERRKEELQHGYQRTGR